MFRTGCMPGGAQGSVLGTKPSAAPHTCLRACQPLKSRPHRLVHVAAATNTEYGHGPRQTLKQTAAAAAASILLLAAGGAQARLEGVNKPELLPQDFTTVIDVPGFLTEGEEKRIKTEIEGLERDKGIKLRVLAQNYPNTPGLAIKDYWKVDGSTVVFVADPSLGNILNFNVGEDLDLMVPRNFWSRLANRYGVRKYWQEKGPETAIVNAVSAIDSCLREPVGKGQCSKIQGELGEEDSSGFFGKTFFGS